MIRFSLVLATVNRREELSRFLDSLSLQNFPLEHVQLIVVDQNRSLLLDEILQSHQTRLGRLDHVRLSERGLSNARNIGLSFVRGAIVAFPDDDCVYDEQVLAAVDAKFKLNEDITFLSVGTADPERGGSLIEQSSCTEAIQLTNVRGCSFTFFFRATAIEGLRFDTCLGVGANTPFRAAEEEDFVVRLLSSGAVGAYFPTPIVFHDSKAGLRAPISRAFFYAAGKGFCIAKNSKRYPKWWLLGIVIFYWTKPMISRPNGLVRAFADVIGFYSGISGFMTRIYR